MYASVLSRPDSFFGQFERLRQELDGLFGVSGLSESIRSVATGSSPALNVGRTPNSIEVYAFAPGLDASKIEVTLDRGVLTVSGERQSSIPTDDPKVNVYARERTFGRFTRAVALPDDVDPLQIQANYKDGVLRVSIARREAARPQRIEVQ
jgi:HSP20 family protein